MIESVGSYEEIYSETLSKEDMANLDAYGVEWRGRNIHDMQDDLHLKIIEIVYRTLENSAQTNPKSLLKIKADLVELFQVIFAEDDDEDEPSTLLYRYDPRTGTYLELIADNGKLKDTIKKTGKALKKAGKKAGKAVKKGAQKVAHGTTKAYKKTAHWVKEHPVATAAIVTVAAVIVFGPAGLATAPAAAIPSSNDDPRKDEDEKPKSSSPSSTSPPPPNPPSSTISSPSTFIPQPSPVPNLTDHQFTYPNTTYSPPGSFNPTPSYDFSRPVVFTPSHSDSSLPLQITHRHIEPVRNSKPIDSAPERSQTLVQQTSQPNAQDISWIDKLDQKAHELGVRAQSKIAHALWDGTAFTGQVVAELGDAALAVVKPLVPDNDLQKMESLSEKTRKTIESGHQKIDEFFGTKEHNSNPLPERNFTFGVIPFPGTGILGKTGQAGKIAQAVESGGVLGETLVVEESALINRPVSIIETTTVTESRVTSVVNKALTTEETLSSTTPIIETEASSPGFVGSKNFQLKQPEFQKVSINPPTRINERLYSGHAIDKMQLQGIQPSLIEDVIKNGEVLVGKEPNTKAYFYKEHNITVILNDKGDVVTTSFGKINQ